MERVTISRSQFCELMGVDPTRLVGLEGVGMVSATFTLVLDPEMTQTSGTFPQVSNATKVRVKKGSK